MTSPPEHAYLLCTMPRSGSTMLCDLLKQTGVAGRPNSFFRPQSMGDFAARWNVPAHGIDDFALAYLCAVRDRGTAGTGCFGMRIMWDNLPGLASRLRQLFPAARGDRACLNAAFGKLKFIHLFRADKVAEAVSYDIAEQSGLWHRNADGTEMERVAPPAEPVYDKARIQAAYADVTAGNDAWLAWFENQAITPLSISYEALAAASAQHLRQILQFIGMDPSRADGIVPGTAPLADERNRAWAERFRAETGLAPATVAP
ncbi:Stf0 family sulfotransferase [Loktanella agnita]|uniref:Stf0 family sulfotransferase n=1 Tax=Loktanella agnita TaxID=287097 RepID=UPI00398A056E